MRWIPVVLSLALLAGCERAPEPPAEAAPTQGVDAREGIAVSGANVVLPVAEGRPGAAYMTIANSGAEEAQLAAIHVDGAERSTLHERRMEGGAVAMAEVGMISIPANGSVVLEEGGLHAMVFGLSPDIEGETVEITLIFADGDKTSLDADLTRFKRADN